MNGIKVYLFLIVDDSNDSVVDNRVFKTKELALACLHKNICETLQDELEMGNKITPDEMNVFEPKDEDIVDENYYYSIEFCGFTYSVEEMELEE